MLLIGTRRYAGAPRAVIGCALISAALLGCGDLARTTQGADWARSCSKPCRPASLTDADRDEPRDAASAPDEDAGSDGMPGIEADAGPGADAGADAATEVDAGGGPGATDASTDASADAGVDAAMDMDSDSGSLEP